MLGNPNTPQGERSLEDTEKESVEEGAPRERGWRRLEGKGPRVGLQGLGWESWPQVWRRPP